MLPNLLCSNVRKIDCTKLIANHGVLSNLAFEGDIVLCEALSDVGALNSLETFELNLVPLSRGLQFIGVVGTRQSGQSILGSVPKGGLIVPGDASLLSNGGLVGLFVASPPNLPPALPIRIIGVLTEDGVTNANISHFLRLPTGPLDKPIIPVVGTSAECGKTTAASLLIQRLSQNYRVGAAKLTGTGRYRDIKMLSDSGAVCAYDFVDAGIPSTYYSKTKALAAAKEVLFTASRNTDLVVAEFGGDLTWGHVQDILSLEDIKQLVPAIVILANDIPGVIYMEHTIRKIVPCPQLILGKVCNVGGMIRLPEYTSNPWFDIFDTVSASNFIHTVENIFSYNQVLVANLR